MSTTACRRMVARAALVVASQVSPRAGLLDGLELEDMVMAGTQLNAELVAEDTARAVAALRAAA